MKPQTHRGFTLVELLVVVAVLAVLTVLGLGVARGFRARANDIKCLSNLRQSGHAFHAYLSDHNGQFLPKKYWFQYTSYRPSSNKGMREYFQLEPDLPIQDERLFFDSVLTCPSMLARYPALARTAFRRGSAINYYLYQTDGEREVASFKNMRSNPNIGAMFIFTDAPVSGGANSPDASGLLGSLNDNTAYHEREFMAYPHSGRTNHFLFFDGHVEALTKEELRKRPNQRDFWGSTAMTNDPAP